MSSRGRNFGAFAAVGAIAFLPRAGKPEKSLLALAAAAAGIMTLCAADPAEAHWRHGGGQTQGAQVQTQGSGQVRHHWTPPQNRAVVIVPQQNFQAVQPLNYNTQPCGQNLGYAYPAYQSNCPPLRQVVVPGLMTGQAGIAALPRPYAAALPGAGQDLVAAARQAAAAARVPASILLAFHDRARSAVALTASREGQGPQASVGGPYGYSQQRWLEAFKHAENRLGGGAAGLTGVIVRGPDGRLAVGDPRAFAAIMACRDDLRTASLVTAIGIYDHTQILRREFGDDVSLADLYVGHMGGPGMMTRIARAARQSPGTPLAAVLTPPEARDLLVLSGLPASGGGYRPVAVAEFETALTAALRASGRGYAAAPVATYAPQEQYAPAPAAYVDRVVAPRQLIDVQDAPDPDVIERANAAIPPFRP